MSIREIQKLSALNYTSNLVLNEVEQLRNDVKNGLESLEKTTKSLDKSIKPKEDWRIVHNPTESEKYPLVQSDADQIIKKLNII
ncbi:MAG: hypothetical protein COW00_00445 [Bdellovibrio sp. CG12_big_fil_rev_8_21_14_0_65_39_13]|nr:MAG: hypothetical protein COW78_04195 [Bdellovibrio sp. CG22_combo_CG10-13_8_21_14_all_39_27]PIQ62952.1 MAG: hypothetical protein COW00_00445 [Bdellovibrio sp. CG12_big_fil_rev_8_21_14_0_65_39_13]PIR32584.1 MAG: hypothetical protein COV37_19420 [Bdellovibrio sp. CG11_big_fil_rev_8_21_14_0_20_39_38]PJB54478.1 MAG: hypothetical protein CO099_01395 [Bdellovibrio sp. CG_4_9_14_3_um_filter_39_7]